MPTKFIYKANNSHILPPSVNFHLTPPSSYIHLYMAQLLVLLQTYTAGNIMDNSQVCYLQENVYNQNLFLITVKVVQSSVHTVSRKNIYTFHYTKSKAFHTCTCGLEKLVDYNVCIRNGFPYLNVLLNYIVLIIAHSLLLMQMLTTFLFRGGEGGVYVALYPKINVCCILYSKLGGGGVSQ